MKATHAPRLTSPLPPVLGTPTRPDGNDWGTRLAFYFFMGVSLLALLCFLALPFFL